MKVSGQAATTWLRNDVLSRATLLRFRRFFCDAKRQKSRFPTNATTAGSMLRRSLWGLKIDDTSPTLSHKVPRRSAALQNARCGSMLKSTWCPCECWRLLGCGESSRGNAQLWRVHVALFNDTILCSTHTCPAVASIACAAASLDHCFVLAGFLVCLLF